MNQFAYWTGRIAMSLGGITFVALVIYGMLAILKEVTEYACKVAGIHKEVAYFILHRQAIRKVITERKSCLNDDGRMQNCA